MLLYALAVLGCLALFLDVLAMIFLIVVFSKPPRLPEPDAPCPIPGECALCDGDKDLCAELNGLTPTKKETAPSLFDLPLTNESSLP